MASEKQFQGSGASGMAGVVAGLDGGGVPVWLEGMNVRPFFLILTLLQSSSMALKSEEPVRVLSFNIRYINSEDEGQRTWLARRDQVGTVIREDKPDIVGLQEAFRTMLDDIKGRVPGYEEIGVGREDGKLRGEYAAILVRKDRMTVVESGTFWLSDTPEVPNSKTWQNRVTRICTWAKLLDRANNRELFIYNAHLDHESQEAREKGLASIMAHVTARHSQGPFILTGDYNAGEDNAAITKLKADPLRPVDTWRELHKDVPFSESGTICQFTGNRNTAKIDYIMVPAGTRILDAEIIHRNEDGVYPSDHFPIRATVEFAPTLPAVPELGAEKIPSPAR